LDVLPDETLAEIAAKRQAYERLQLDAGTDGLSLALNLYCASYLLPKHGTETDTDVPTTQDVMNALLGQTVSERKKQAASNLAKRVPLLHWRLGFAQVFARGGFSVILANPPWERMKLQEEEYFAERAPAVAEARNKSERERLIRNLGLSDPSSPERRIYEDFIAAKQVAEAGSVYCHGPRYPFTGTGDVNAYALFAETSLQILHPLGRAGLVLPSGIATDDTTSKFFGFISKGRIVQLIDFENSKGIFPGVHRSYKFCLLTIGAVAVARFAFFLSDTNQLKDNRRSFSLSEADISLLNPNSLNCPVFRSRRDAELTSLIARSNPILKRDDESDSGWNIKLRRMFDVSSDATLLIDHQSINGHVDLLPVHEGELGHQFNHREMRYENGIGIFNSDDWLTQPNNLTTTFRYCSTSAFLDKSRRMGLDELPCKSAFLGFRRVARSTDERTVISCIFNWQPSTYGWILTLGETASNMLLLCGMYNSLVFDYLLRGKLSQPSIPQGTFEQVHVVPRKTISADDAQRIGSRVLELSYTANDLESFYTDVVTENQSWDTRKGNDRGKPWHWNANRRFIQRAELDAIFARLYGLSRDDLRFILDPVDVMGEDYPSESFRVLKDKEIRHFGEYRTRRLVLEAWDKLELGELK
jgi:hypothetical protein